MEAVAPEVLFEVEVEEEVEVGDDAVELAVGLVTLAEAGRSSQRAEVIKEVGGKIHTAAFFFLKCKGSLLVCSGAICNEAVGRCFLEACTVTNTGEVGAADVSGVSEIEKKK